MEKTLLTVQESASLLGVSSSTVRNWIGQGLLEGEDSPGSLFLMKGDVEGLQQKISLGQVDRLARRANKLRAQKTFLPEEYLESEGDESLLEALRTHLPHPSLKPREVLFFLALNLSLREGLVQKAPLEDLLSFRPSLFGHPQIFRELRDWFQSLKNSLSKEEGLFLLQASLPAQGDILGLVYQSILPEGHKARSGSYYTPSAMVRGMAQQYRGGKALDPCCGSGQFLVALADQVDHPSLLYGLEVDELAFRIARINLLLRFRDVDFQPQIYRGDFLLNPSLPLFREGPFDFIATNPPWGQHFSRIEKKKLMKVHRALGSLESFSLFLKRGLEVLKKEGTLSFLLPESFLNVKAHQDIRQHLLEKAKLQRIRWWGRIFSEVFTPVIQLDLKKSSPKSHQFWVEKKGEKYSLSSERFSQNPFFIFDIHTKKKDHKLLSQVYKQNHTTLKGRADFAMGIVTGDNGRFLSTKPQKGCEEIILGRNVRPYRIEETSHFISFHPEKFQQMAPIVRYKSPEKLVYKFISRHLVFGWDDRQRLVLNSANILIPRVPDYPAKALLALFNSSLYQFLFQKKFSSLKVLKSHLEELPLPLWERDRLGEITGLVQRILSGEKRWKEVDELILKAFGFNKQERTYIQTFYSLE